MNEENLNIDLILDDILNGKITLREASKRYGYSRDFWRNQLNKKYAGDNQKIKLIKKVMKENRASSTLEIDEKKLEEVFLKVMNNEMKLQEAQDKLGISDIGTLRQKFYEFAKGSKKENMAEKYREYVSNGRNDYTYINFRVLAIEMIRNNFSQLELSEYTGIPARTISREFEKLSNDEDTRLYDLLKDFGYKKMHRHRFSNDELLNYDRILMSYEADHPELLETNTKSKTEEKEEREDYLVEEEKKLKAQGLTQKEIAQRLGTSVSGLRRARLSKEKREAGLHPNTIPDTLLEFNERLQGKNNIDEEEK
jgi:hypothetical protein